MFVVECVPAPGGVAVDPCGTVSGTAMAPLVRHLNAPPVLDLAALGDLFAWAFSLVGIAFAVGLTVGAIMRVIRSA